jgi:hypothetical protein
MICQSVMSFPNTGSFFIWGANMRFVATKTPEQLHPSDQTSARGGPSEGAQRSFHDDQYRISTWSSRGAFGRTSMTRSLIAQEGIFWTRV